MHTMHFNERTVHMIDTPGFDDSMMSDEATFEELAYWLAEAYKRGVQLNGIIYLHRITDRRFNGSARRALLMLEAICGKDAMSGVVIATTMWDLVPTGELETAWARHDELRAKSFASVLAHGGHLEPLTAVKRVARRIIGHILGRNELLTLTFQEEFVDEGVMLEETAAGKVLLAGLIQYLEPDSTFDTHSTKGTSRLRESLKNTSSDLAVKWQEKTQQETETLKNESFCCRQALLQTRGVGTNRQSDDWLAFGYHEQGPDGLRAQLQSISLQQKHKLAHRKYVNHGRGTKTLGVVGTGLAVGQLVAAMACTIM